VTGFSPDERDQLKALVKEALAELLAERGIEPPQRKAPRSRAGLLTLEQASELLAGTSTETIRRWIWEGRLRAYKPGMHQLVRESELLAFVEASETRAKRVARRRAAKAARE